jgi:hypothetical protein
MKNKNLITTKIEKIDNALSNLASFAASGTPPNQIKDYIFEIKEKLQDIQTLINTEAEGWN